MSTLAHTVADSATMLRRNLKHAVRYPSLTVMVIALPVIFLLLFVYVFGGTLGNGLGGVAGGRSAYADYVTPGILLLAMAGAAQGTAIAVAMDMTEGIVARFRTMSIARAAVLTGHVVGAVTQTLLGLVVVVAVALLVGFRPDAGPAQWLAVSGSPPPRSSPGDRPSTPVPPPPRRGRPRAHPRGRAGPPPRRAAAPPPRPPARR
ncbi:hypothetical protein EAD96_13010 [Micromonospora sp. BL1]|uniref:ABC transporter permease n=1 Tax=Micromonospora sp. BL1 TaxID=2478709 RepID=UPI000EF59190|nr:hypothetical protein EAD96_13010 [Micromonospora sp. BL1]